MIDEIDKFIQYLLNDYCYVLIIYIILIICIFYHKNIYTQPLIVLFNNKFFKLSILLIIYIIMLYNINIGILLCILYTLIIFKLIDVKIYKLLY